MNDMKRLSVTCLCVWFSLAIGALAGDFVLVDTDGRPACKVVLRPDATQPERTAQKILVEYVERSTGTRLQGAEAKDSRERREPAIYLGVRHPKEPPYERGDAFEVTVRQDGIRLLGDTPPSVIYGVTSFLEKYVGVRWLAPEKLWTVIPKRRGLAIPLGSCSEAAGVPIRCMHITGVHMHEGKRYAHWNFEIADWMMHNRINRKMEHVDRFKLVPLMAERGLTPLRGGHALRFWMPNDLFFDDHPEYYGYNGFARVPIRGGGTQLNYSSVEMSEVFAQRVIDYLHAHPGVDRMLISLNDGYGFSLDPISKREWFYAPNGTPVLSDTVFGFSNRVAAVVSREFPSVSLAQLAYTQYYHRPPRFDLHPNLGIKFTMYRGSSVNPMCEATNDRDRQMRWELEEWRKKTDKIVVGEYLTNYWADAMFASGVRMIAKDIEWYHRMGFQGVATECQPGKLAREMLYVYTRMLWNPKQDYLDIVRDFYASAYGRGSVSMLAAYREYQKAIEQCGYDGVGTHLAIALSNIPGFRERMLGLIDAAHASAELETEKARIGTVRDELGAFMARAEPLAGYQVRLDREPSPDALLTPANVAPNPSFEKKLAGWTFSSLDSGFHLESNDSAAWHGKKSLAIVGPPDRITNCRAEARVEIPVNKGDFYDIGIMVRPDKHAIDSFSIMYQFLSGVEFVRKRRRARVGPALLCNEWRPFGFGICKATSDKIAITFRVYRGAGTWHFDGLSVAKLACR